MYSGRRAFLFAPDFNALAWNKPMPKVIPIGPYTLYFWSRENSEPPHIHVRREDFEAKFWLNEWVELSANHGFRAHELNRI